MWGEIDSNGKKIKKQIKLLKISIFSKNTYYISIILADIHSFLYFKKVDFDLLSVNKK